MTIDSDRPTVARRALPGHLVTDLALLFVTILVLLRVYAWIDPSEMRDGAIFPWDSGVYQFVAHALPHWNFSDPIIAAYPWGPRLLFPAIYGGISQTTGLADFQAAYLVEVAAVVLVSLITFAFWRRCQISRPLSWIGILLFCLTWEGPLRLSGLFPGAGLASQQLTVWMVFTSIVLANKVRPLRITSACVLIFLAALSREFAAYVAVLVVVLALIVKLAARRNVTFDRFPLLDDAIRRFGARPLSGLLLLMGASSAGYALAHFIVQDPADSYSMAKTAVAYGYFHLNVMEVLYPYFYALGPFALVFVLAMTFARTRRCLAQRLRKYVSNLDLVLLFILISVLFSLFGGTDSDRFLLWMFPFFGVLGLESVVVLREIGGRRVGAALIALLAVGLLWTRFYVPAIPHLFFPGDNYCAQAGVRTNYDPNLYAGPPLMTSLRKPLITVPINPDHADLPGTLPADASAQIPAGCDPSLPDVTPHAYAANINTVPFPLGFAHNQYELLAAHPYHGNWQIRVMLFAQWGAIYLGLVALLWAPARTKRPAPSTRSAAAEAIDD